MSNKKIELNDFKGFGQATVEVFKYNSVEVERIKKQIEEFQINGLDTDLSDIFQTNDKELICILGDGLIRKAIIHIVDITSWWYEDQFPN